jgi:hypothetical protein
MIGSPVAEAALSPSILVSTDQFTQVPIARTPSLNFDRLGGFEKKSERFLIFYLLKR